VVTAFVTEALNRSRKTKMSDAGIDDLDSMIVRQFGRHFVSLTCDHQHPGKPATFERFVTSGFLLAINDQWYIATAGHVIDNIIARMGQEPQRVYSFGIIDNFGADAKHHEVIPFDFKNALTWKTDPNVTGADFGLIWIPPFYRRLMEANNPQPFVKEQWRYERDEQFEGYAMMGIPSETVTKSSLDEKNYRMAMFPLKEITELPEGITPSRYPTFYAELGPTPYIESIEGMSGCPIFGFAMDEAGRLRYWVVAVQSGWYRDRMPRIITASLFKCLASAAEDHFNLVLEEMRAEG
jgi:hypothetical protein